MSEHSNFNNFHLQYSGPYLCQRLNIVLVTLVIIGRQIKAFKSPKCILEVTAYEISRIQKFCMVTKPKDYFQLKMVAKKGKRVGKRKQKQSERLFTLKKFICAKFFMLFNFLA